MNKFSNLKIVDFEYQFPKNYIDLFKNYSNLKSWNIEKTIKKTGIKRVYHTNENETALDLSVKACNKIIKNNNIDRNSIDSLIFVTQSPDYILPTTACILQDKLNLSKKILAFDINLGCSGFVKSLSVATALINSKIVNNTLIVCADTYSKYIDKNDKKNIPLFSDCASVCYLKKGGNLQIGPFEFGTDGKGSNNLIVKGSGTRKINSNEKKRLFMNGNQILLFTLDEIPKLVNNFLKKIKIKKNDINYYIFHQANKLVVEQLSKKLNLEKNKVVFSAQNQGNTISSTIPVALKDLLKKNKLKKNDKILLIGFGVGYSWGITLINW